MYEVKAYAKINIGLDILSERSDGYHDIKTIMQKISLYDTMKFEVSDNTKILTGSTQIPLNEENLIIKAKRALEKEVGKKLDFVVHLDKKIPVAAGLAGGSSNGAETMKALNLMYSLGLNRQELRDISVKVGADLPFLISGKCSLAEGIGEKLTEIPNNLEKNVLLINSGVQITAKEVYEDIDKNYYGLIDIDDIVRSLKFGKLKNKGSLNLMEKYVFTKYPHIEKLVEELYEHGADYAGMSGSGSTVYGLFNESEKAYLHFKRSYPEYFTGVYEMIT